MGPVEKSRAKISPPKAGNSMRANQKDKDSNALKEAGSGRASKKAGKFIKKMLWT